MTQLDAMRKCVAECGSAVVAFSGGVDSTVVLRIASDVLGAHALGVMGISRSVAPEEKRLAAQLAETMGARLLLVETREQDDPRYVANAPDRCFWCKSELYRVCRQVALEHGLRWILNGTNADDPGDWRPGLRAADQAGVRSPLLECGLRKADVRALARQLGLPNWDKPALACLASRLPYGTTVSPGRLAAVDLVETQLRRMGFSQVRARHHGSLVRIEVEPEHVGRMEALQSDPQLLDAVRAAGFQQLAIEADGYRPGRLNQGLKPLD